MKIRLPAAFKISISFLVLILIGALLLSTPLASVSGKATSFIDSLFTATSAVCVTGLTVVDTASHWNIFGQIVLLVLIQAGGLGIMTFFSIFSYIIHNKISLEERMYVGEASALGDSLSYDLKRILKFIVFGTLIVELAGAVIFSVTFIKDFGLGKGIYYSIFTSVSAFCNAGMDVFGIIGGKGSMEIYYNMPAVIIPISTLIILGGLGFFVWQDVWKYIKNIFSPSNNRPNRLSMHTKVVITVTGVLIIGGMVLFYLLECNNPDTLANESFGNRLLISFFQSVTARTAGFYSVNIGLLKESTLFIMIILMFIGAAPGSTAGGAKVTTVYIVYKSIIATLRRRQEVTSFKKRINNDIKEKAITVFMIYIIMTSISSIILMSLEDITLTQALFESVSAMCTVGLTTGITSSLSVIGKMVITIMMFAGRIGITSLIISMMRSSIIGEKIKYTQGRIYI